MALIGSEAHSWQWRPLSLNEIRALLRLSIWSQSQLRFFLSPYWEELQTTSTSFSQIDKLQFWKQAVYVLARAKADLFVTAEELVPFLKTLLSEQQFPFLLQKPNILIATLCRDLTLVSEHCVSQSHQDSRTEFTNHASWSMSIVHNLLAFLIPFYVIPDPVLETGQVFICVAALKDLANDFFQWLNEGMHNTQNLLKGASSLNEFLLRDSTIHEFLQLTLGAKASVSHYNALIWYLSNHMGHNCICFSSELGPNKKVNTLKIALDKKCEVNESDRGIVSETYTLEILEERINIICEKLRARKADALQAKRRGNTQVALTVLKQCKIFESHLDQLYALQLQLLQSLGSRERASTLSVVHQSMITANSAIKASINEEHLQSVTEGVYSSRDSVSELNQQMEEALQNLEITEDWGNDLQQELKNLQDTIEVEKTEKLLANCSPATHELYNKRARRRPPAIRISMPRQKVLN